VSCKQLDDGINQLRGVVDTIIQLFCIRVSGVIVSMKGGSMKRIPILVVATIAVCAIALITVAASGADDEAAPIFGIKIPPGYRDWKLISVAHEEGNLNDLRAVLGNEVAIKAYREGKLPFPDGTIIARLAWSYVPSEENKKVSRLSSPMRSAFGGQSELKRCAGAGRGRGK
jgi:Cytochrome P460